MNKIGLKLTHDSLIGWLTKCQEETVSADKKLEIIMVSLANLCKSLATDGTEESIEAFCADDKD